MSDLEQILNGETPETPAAPEVVVDPEVKAEPTGGEAKVEEVPAEPKPEVKAEEPQTVPVGVVQELRRELRELKAAQNQKPEAPAPDMFEDPDGYRNYMQAAVQSSGINSKLEMSRFMAEREFGKEVVDAAFDYFSEHPEQSQALLKSASPFHAVVEQYNNVRVAQEIGNDPTAYRAKLEAEIRAKVEAELVAKQARDAAGKFAPSLANVTGTGGGPKNEWTGPTPLSKVIGS